MRNGKPKLCYIVPEYDPASHTHVAYLTDFIRELADSLDVFVIVEKSRGPMPHLGERETRVVHSRLFPFRLFALFSSIIAARIRGYRTFYVHYSFLGAFLASLVVRISGGSCLYWNCGLPWQFRRSIVRERFERLVYRLVSVLVTGTEGLRAQYADHYGIPQAKVRVMPNWLNLKAAQRVIDESHSAELRASLRIGGRDRMLLFVHRLSERKGAHVLPDILAAFREERAVLVILGDGPLRAVIEDRFAAEGLKDRVRFLGWVPQKDILSYMAAADIFLMPSREEGFPHVLLEAMAAGTPFAAYGVGGVPEMAPPELSEYIVKAEDLQALIQKTKFLLRCSSKERAVISEYETEWIQQFDIKNVAFRFLELIREKA